MKTVAYVFAGIGISGIITAALMPKKFTKESAEYKKAKTKALPVFFSGLASLAIGGILLNLSDHK